MKSDLLSSIGNKIKVKIDQKKLNKVKNKFIEHFKKSHMYTLPISLNELKEHCNLNNININDYKYNKINNLITNACLGPDCPF